MPTRRCAAFRVTCYHGVRSPHALAAVLSLVVSLEPAARPPVYLALNLARTRVHGRQFQALGGKTNGVLAVWGRLSEIVVTRAPVKGRTPLSLVDHGGQDKRVKGLEPSTFTLAT